MISVPSIKRIARRVVSAVLAAAVLCTGVVAYADEPYTGYNYDWWGDPVPSQNGYVVDRVVSGIDIGCGQMTNPVDIFFDDNDMLYIADSGYVADPDSRTRKGRVIVTDSNFGLAHIIERLDFSDMDEWLAEKKAQVDSGALAEDRYSRETNVYLNTPTGVFVDEDNVYVADSENERVVQFAIETSGGESYGKVREVFTRPDGIYYDAGTTFRPEKVLIDAAKNVYVCITTITRGAVVFSREGEFNGYYGANRVEKTGEVILNAFWKLIMTTEQIKRMKRSVPVELTNFDIDDDNFVYTVTKNKNSDTDILKKMNSAGTNIFINLGYNEYTFGDPLVKYYRGTTYSSQICDVDVGPNGEINLLDLTTGRVFQYDDECTLMFIFGGSGDQKGTFSTVNAVESLGTNVYVLDSSKSTVTVFKRTEFGSIVHEAMSLFNAGKYNEAMEPWREVLRRDSNYWMAYIGLGNAYLNAKDYEAAMDNFYLQSRSGYSDAFKSWRMNFIRENFTLFALIIVAIFVAIYVVSSVRNKSRAKKRAAADKILREQQKKEEG
ncbi:MAG: hypothetical protein NC299_03655 [Lachnospiraceae bacterium]|nr:hypothetical protein [Ruminococcus sp.]MCM1274444.1 hypothetical protein [Lachnospiraceae bacterium]